VSSERTCGSEGRSAPSHGALPAEREGTGALLGSGVIIPVRHAETVFDLTRDEIDATFALLADVRAWMDERFHPDGYNVGWNCGAAGGQIAMHAHMHVIPRFRQEPYAGRGIRYWLKQPANRWW